MRIDQQLADMIQRYATHHSITAASVSRSIYESLGFTSINSAQGYISELFKGSLYGHSSSMYSETRIKNLDRTAIILQFIGVPADDPIIKRITELDARFEYPPKTSYLPPATNRPSNKENLEARLRDLEAKLKGLDARDYELIITLVDRLTTAKSKRKQKRKI